MSGTKWIDLIPRAVEECAENGFDVLVIDPFVTFAGLRGGEENDSGPVGERLRLLRSQLQKHNIAGVCIHHGGKDNNLRGSSSFIDEADIVVEMSQPEGNHKDTVRKLEIYGRHGKQTKHIELDLDDGTYSDVGDAGNIEFRKAINFISDLIVDHTTKDTALSTKEIKDCGGDAKLRSTNIENALAWMVKKNMIKSEKHTDKRGQPRVYWKPDLTNVCSPETPVPNGRITIECETEDCNNLPTTDFSLCDMCLAKASDW